MLVQVVELIESKRRFAITSHIRPDGDGLGSSLGLYWLLTALGKEPEVIMRDPVPHSYEHVDIRLHSIIYKVEEEIRAAMIGMLEAIESEKILGKADVRQVFKVPRAGTVAGCMVVDGVIRRNARARLIRDGVVAWEGGIDSLRRVKDDVSEVREGFECGISLENFNDIKVGDQIEAYIVEKVAATEL